MKEEILFKSADKARGALKTRKRQGIEENKERDAYIDTQKINCLLKKLESGKVPLRYSGELSKLEKVELQGGGYRIRKVHPISISLTIHSSELRAGYKIDFPTKLPAFPCINLYHPFKKM